MATFFECFFENNPDGLDNLAEIVAPEVLSLITGPTIETAAGLVDGLNTDFTLSAIPNPPSSLGVTLISGGTFTNQVLGVDYNTAIIASVFTIQMVVPPVPGESVQAVYYVL